ncbi:MAG TPA: S41 family peptidase, partial [Puia sp.]|nr:S41 family peptidase [Puia sp.]
MKRIICLVLFLYGTGVTAQIDTVSNLSDAEKIMGLSEFWSEAANNFVYFDKTHINWDSAYQAFIPKVLATRNTWNYYLVLKQFAALLHDGHTGIQESFALYHNSSRYKFINFECVNKHFFVTNIDLSDSSKVPLGSELISVDQVPLADWMRDNIFPYICASTEQQLYNDAAWDLFYGTDTTQRWQLALKTPQGKMIRYAAYYHTYRRHWEVPDPPYQRTRYERMGNIGYFQINTFGDRGVVDDFQKILPEIRGCKGMILDIRRNGGGNSEIGAEILKYFTDANPLVGSAWQTKENISAFKAWGKYFRKKNPDSLSAFERKCVQNYNNNYWYKGDTMRFENNISVPRITLPLVVLMGNSTASAAEDFLIMLSNLKNRALTIGQTSFGSTGQPLSFDLPGGGSGQVCSKKDTYPDGKEFVGYGIKPDIVVEKNIEAILKHRDPELETALKEL